MTEQRQNRTWIGRGAWAVTDQGLYVLSNALLNILLARWLVPAEYGTFAIAYSALLLIGAFHAAVFIEPMLVFGSGRYAGWLAGYLRILVRGNYVLTIAGSCLLIVAGAGVWLLGSRPLAHALFGLAAAVPFTLFMWLAKRASYVRQQTRLAAAQSAIYLMLLLPGLFVLKRFQLVSVFSGAVIMGFAGAVAGLWLMHRIRTTIPDSEEPPGRRAVLTAHWIYGRWALLTGVLMWVPLNLYFVVLSASIGFEASATLKAITNLVLPVLQANAALSALLLPLLVSRRDDRDEFRRLFGRALALFATVAVLYALMIGALGEPLVHLLYGGRYHTTAGVLWLLALIPVLDGVTIVFASALRSLEQPKQVFRAQLFAAACVLSVGVAATGAWGVAGAIGAMVLAGLSTSMLLAISVRKHLAYPALVLNPKARTNMQNDERQNYCDLCEEEGTLYGREKGYDLLSCRRCGLFWTNPLKHDSQEATAEATYSGEVVYLSNSISQKKRFRRQLKTFVRKAGGKDVKSLRVLEVGSGLGFFLDACEELGIAAEGCDIVGRAVRFANRERERVRLGTLDDYYPDESFDAIFAFNLIEHLPHPKDLFTQAHRILKPGGTLVLETPIQESLFHRLARVGHALSQGRLNFFGMRPGGHIYKFSKRTFREEIGFKKVYQRNIESPFGELWGNSSVLNLNHKFLYRWSLPLAWMLAKVTKQGNRLFLLLRKSLETQTVVSFDTATGLTQR
jgi:O-antigen/teichoic acid export membrane protein/SAM-dependent methyltransferase